VTRMFSLITAASCRRFSELETPSITRNFMTRRCSVAHVSIPVLLLLHTTCMLRAICQVSSYHTKSRSINYCTLHTTL
jgi:hypothetical protein